MARKQIWLGRISSGLLGTSMADAIGMYYDLQEAADGASGLARSHVPVAAVTCMEAFYRQVGRHMFRPEGRMHTPVALRITAADLPGLARIVPRLSPADLFWLDRSVQNVDDIRSVQDEAGMESVFKGDPWLLDATGRMYHVRNDIVHGRGDKPFDVDEVMRVLRLHIEKSLAQMPPLLAAFRLIGGIRADMRGGRMAGAPLYREAIAEADGSKADPSVCDVVAGKAAEGLGQDGEAIRRYKRAASADPGNADAHASLGRIHWLRGCYEDALAGYDRAVEADPDYANAYIGRGDMLACLGRPGDALESYRLAAGADPSSAAPHMAAGQIHESQGRPGDALESYRLAAGADPSSAAPHVAAGHVYKSTDRISDALVSYRLAAGADPSSAAPHMAAGQIHESQGRPGDALESYLLAAGADPASAAPHMAAGHVYESMNRMSDALESYRLAAGADPASAATQIAVDTLDKALDSPVWIKPSRRDVSILDDAKKWVSDGQARALKRRGRLSDAGDLVRHIKRPNGRGGDDGRE